VFAHIRNRLQLAQLFPTPSAASLYIINNKESALQMLLHCKALNGNQKL
jgi:hypothetical protein